MCLRSFCKWTCIMLKFDTCIIKLRLSWFYFWTYVDGKLADKLELTLCSKVLITEKLKLSRRRERERGEMKRRSAKCTKYINLFFVPVCGFKVKRVELWWVLYVRLIIKAFIIKQLKRLSNKRLNKTKTVYSKFRRSILIFLSEGSLVSSENF